MSRRIRLVVLLARPAVMLLLAMFAATGLAAAGRGQDTAALARALVAVTGFLLFSVACNDLADEAIDRVNLPGRRPLTNGTGTRREMAIAGGTGAVMALAASVTLHWPAIVVTAAGLAVSAGYSLRPVRLADRGAVASLMLPACYVAVPYLTGVFAAGATVTPRELLLLAGLYLGFTGRILLKDFRDVRGDALFGKRTFLVRRGRGWTCAISVGCWAAGTGVMLAAAPGPATGLAVAEGACLLLVLALLADLSRSRSARRDEFRISALAIAGRGMILLLLAHLSMTGAGGLAPAGSGFGVLYPVVLVLLAAATIGMAASMAAYGPACRADRSRLGAGRSGSGQRRGCAGSAVRAIGFRGLWSTALAWVGSVSGTDRRPGRPGWPGAGPASGPAWGAPRHGDRGRIPVPIRDPPAGRDAGARRGVRHPRADR